MSSYRLCFQGYFVGIIYRGYINLPRCLDMDRLFSKEINCRRLLGGAAQLRTEKWEPAHDII